MKNILKFLLAVGELKRKKRRGWLVYEIKNPETTAEHIFRVTLLAWLLGRKKGLHRERVVKIALVHDLCEVFAPDLTPYDPLLPKDKKKIKEVLKRWPKFTTKQKIKREREKLRLETRGLEKLISRLPEYLKKEIRYLWLDFSQGITKEGRFVRQVDKLENFLQGMEYWKKYGRIQHKLWRRWIKEIIDDPVLLELLDEIENKFH